MSKLEKSDQDDDYEEEEILIYMDVDTYVSQKEIMDKDVQIKILGIDQKRPIMQIGNRIFEGIFLMIELIGSLTDFGIFRRIFSCFGHQCLLPRGFPE